MERTISDGEVCSNARISDCDCLASECVNYCVNQICQAQQCTTTADCGASDLVCEEHIDYYLGSIGTWCKYQAPCPEGSPGCPCYSDGSCNAPFDTDYEAVCNGEGLCQENDLCPTNCREGSVCCGGMYCSGMCIGTPCC